MSEMQEVRGSNFWLGSSFVKNSGEWVENCCAEKHKFMKTTAKNFNYYKKITVLTHSSYVELVKKNLLTLLIAFLVVKTSTHLVWGRVRKWSLIRTPRQVWPLMRPSQTEVISDQTSVHSKCAQSRRWSDEFQTEMTSAKTSIWPLSIRISKYYPYQSALEMLSQTIISNA